MRLSVNVADTSGPSVTVVVKNTGNQTANMGVYVAFVPPGGTSNPGGCSAPVTQGTEVVNWVQFVNGQNMLTNVPPGARIALKADVLWECSNPAAIDGQTWTVAAIADINADDFSSCDTFMDVFDGTCSTALSTDDNNPSNDILTRTLPIVTFVP